MIAYTTITIPVDVYLDLTSARIIVSIDQEDPNRTDPATGKPVIIATIDKEIETFSVENGVTSFGVPLTQEETGLFRPGLSAKMMINWIFPEGGRDAAGPQWIPFFENLLDKVISCGD